MNKNITASIGNTPLVRLKNISSDLPADIYAKLEFYNPAGSIKDRIAYAMIVEEEKQGKINPDTVIIEPTSGNTGIGLAFVCAAKGYKLILTMPETMSIERQHFLRYAGAEIVLTKGENGMPGSIEKAQQLIDMHNNAFMPRQFSNPANVNIHLTTTGPEIWDGIGGDIDYFIAGVGTGGTITGCTNYLKSQKDITSVAVEPEASPVISKGIAGSHKIQGIGAGFIPDIFEREIIDEIYTVTNEDAFKYMKISAREEGVFCGISSGAALAASYHYAQKPSNKGKNIVTIFPDALDRYLSLITSSKAGNHINRKF